jgi:DNA-binding transcriptional LysR family regulator
MNISKVFFLRVVESGSFKKAAELLNVEPSSISRKVAALESRLNVKLLNRSTVRSTPTELGQKYYDRLRYIVEEEESLDEDITSDTNRISGTLRIAAPVDFGAEFVVPLCCELQKKYKELSFEMKLGSSFVNLIENKLDVAVRIGQLPDSNLIAKKMGDIPRVLVASPDYLKAYGAPQTPEDLKNHNFVFYSPLQMNSDIEFQNGLKFSHTKLKSNFMANSVTAIRHLVINGMGIHLGPQWFFSRAIKNGLVTPILTQYPLNSFPAYSVFTDRSYMPRKIKVFIDELKKVIGKIDDY